MQRRQFHLAMAGACLWPHVGAHASAGYPTKPVRIVVPYSAGGPVDLISRALAVSLGQSWSQPVVVDNKPGANELIAAAEVARALPDGHTLVMGSDPTLSQNRFLYAKMPYDDEKAFAPVIRLAVINMALFVPAGLPVSNLQEFLAYAKARPRQLSYGSSGIGNVTHLSMAWLEKSTGIEMTHLPYKGLAPVVSDMLGSQIQAAFGAVSVVEPYVKSGKLKAIAVSGDRRAKLLPQVATFTEQGHPGIDANLTVALLAPSGTPGDVVGTIANDVRTILLQPAFREKYIDGVAFDLVADTPAQFAAYLVKDRERQLLRIQASGVRLE
jgi:tripartite-type tricarboxylate transporter receptor subunit TctC